MFSIFGFLVKLFPSLTVPLLTEEVHSLPKYSLRGLAAVTVSLLRASRAHLAPRLVFSWNQFSNVMLQNVLLAGARVVIMQKV